MRAREEDERTYEEACETLGYETPPTWPPSETKTMIIEAAEELTEGGTVPLSEQHQNLARAQIDEFY